MKKWINIIWLIISIAVLMLVLYMILNTMVSYKYEIDERRILGKLIQGFDFITLDVASGYLKGTILTLKGFALYVLINMIFIVATLFVKNKD